MSETAIETIDRIGVVGGGIMGTGIAEVCLRADLDVRLVEVSRDAAQLAEKRIQRSMERAVERGRLDARVADDALSDRLTVGTALDAMEDRQMVVEAVVEDRRTKLGVFARLCDVIVDPQAILATNTSSIPIVDLASASGDRGRFVVGLHFFNPVPVLRLVELIPSLLTSPETLARTRSFVTHQLEKDAIEAPDRAGFTVNALLIPYLLSAIRMLEQGLATAKDIDKGMVEGCAHPMGPLALADLIGLDTVLSVSETLYAEHREQLFAPPPLLQRLVAAGLLGKKCGRGLLSYE